MKTAAAATAGKRHVKTLSHECLCVCPVFVSVFRAVAVTVLSLRAVCSLVSALMSMSARLRVLSLMRTVRCRFMKAFIKRQSREDVGG